MHALLVLVTPNFELSNFSLVPTPLESHLLSTGYLNAGFAVFCTVQAICDQNKTIDNFEG